MEQDAWDLLPPRCRALYNLASDKKQESDYC